MSEVGAAPKWGKQDDAKLAALFRKKLSKGGVSPQDLGRDNIEKVRQTHFPERAYRNFAPLFRRKARAFNVESSLAGARKAQGTY